MNPSVKCTRRQFLGQAVTGAVLAAGTGLVPRRTFSASKPLELVHLSPLTASDGEVWAQMVQNFNDAHKHKGVQIRMEVVPYEQLLRRGPVRRRDPYRTRILASAITGRAADFGWATAGLSAKLAKEGVIVPLDELARNAGLDLDDFAASSLRAARYPQYNNALYMIPMDLMSLQPEINLDHVAEAGLPLPNAPKGGPQSGAELIEWGAAMTKRRRGKVTRSGILMTGSGVQPTVTWGIVAHQMGFRRASNDLRTAAVNPRAGIEAMEWVLGLFDEHRIATRDLTDRYKAFGAGQGSIFWTGPWTLNGYVKQGLNFGTCLFPQIGKERATFFATGGLELYRQRDPSRYAATMEAVKWLSDNSFLWTTVGRGVTPRKSIAARGDYREAGPAWSVRGAFVEGMDFAVIGEVPVTDGPDFSIYSGVNFLAETLDGVWAGKLKPEAAMARLAERWQAGLNRR